MFGAKDRDAASISRGIILGLIPGYGAKESGAASISYGINLKLIPGYCAKDIESASISNGSNLRLGMVIRTEALVLSHVGSIEG